MKRRQNRKAGRPLLVVFLTVFIDLLGFGIVLPLLPLYGKQFAIEHQLTAAQVGWVTGLLMASFSAMQFLFLPIWGRLSDVYGRRPILILGLAGSTLCYALFGLAAVWRSLFWMFTARIGAGIAGATISTAQAYIADVSPKDSRASGMALIGAAFSLGFTLGPLIGVAALWLGGSVVMSPWPGYAASVLSGIALVLAIVLLPESRQDGGGARSRSMLGVSALRASLSIPSIGLLLAASFILVVTFAVFESTLAWQVDDILEAKEAAISEAVGEGSLDGATGESLSNRAGEKRHLRIILFTFAYLGMVMAVTQGVLVRRAAKRMPEVALAVGGILVAIVGFALLAVAARHGHFWLLVVAMAIEVVGFSFVTPALQSLISRRTSPHDQGQVLGIGQSVASLARIVGPVAGLSVFSFAPSWPYWGSILCLAVGLLMTLLAARFGRDYAA